MLFFLPDFDICFLGIKAKLYHKTFMSIYMATINSSAHNIKYWAGYNALCYIEEGAFKYNYVNYRLSLPLLCCLHRQNMQSALLYCDLNTKIGDLLPPQTNLISHYLIYVWCQNTTDLFSMPAEAILFLNMITFRRC